MEKKEIVMELERTTKNTYRYSEVEDGQPPIIKTLYIAKWVVGKTPPDKIKVVISPLKS